MKLGIGIDTGGTYTDAVIYNFEDKSILGTAKSLTTRQDLTIGILGAIDGLPRELVRQAEMISLSTTLATNACVENKGGQAKLIFFGGDKKVIDQHGQQFGLPSSDEIYLQESYTHFSGTADREPDWALFEEQIETGFDNLDGVGIIELNAVRNGAVVEKEARERFLKKHDIPVVCGYELFSELNCLQRGSSTLLNAGLFPVIHEFLGSVKQALEARDIHPKSLVIVRSDGSLMSEEFASLRPVETLLCGPAASAIGCVQLADSPNSIVVDMGGTTTDIAFIKEGSPVAVTDGVSIGKWKTYVSGLYVKTFGLGGDSAVHYSGSNLRLEEYRVIPMCVAAANYPAIVESLKGMEKRKHTRFLYEHYALMKEIDGNPRYTEEEQAFCRALREKPLPLAEAAQAVGRDIYTLSVDRLLHDGVVQICGLTPTDMMHIRGDFGKYNAEASRLAAEFAAFNLGITVEALCEKVYDLVEKKMYINLVKAMMEIKSPHYMKNGISPEVERLIAESYEEAKSGAPDSLLSLHLGTRFSLVGAGAPIQVFLEDVAKLLGTRCVIPENHQVANALGAIVGSVSGSCTLEIRPGLDDSGASVFRVYGTDGVQSFAELEDAVAWARPQAEEAAVAQARQRGACGEVSVHSHISGESADVDGGTVYLGTLVTASAVGSLAV